MNNEKGFVTPVTLILSLLLFSLLFYQVQQYTVEKRFLKEQEEILTMDALMQMGVVDIIDIIGAFDTPPQTLTGQLRYVKGNVHYVIAPGTEERLSVKLECVTNNGRKRNIEIFYDIISSDIIDWIET
ncbi:competence type IV pilus minor pilin ComGG [Anaerobacillus sp. MEB173]|uniref:competence type IV pilus minor pilin ComGG n=1 Tax=Anaerobacillus sp. MEB173 TaxID=3383345 RepID=UPI003F8F67CA